MAHDKYVDDNGDAIVKEDPKKILMKYGIVLIVFIIVIIIVVGLIGNKSKSVCFDFEKKIKDEALRYVNLKSIVPTIGGDYVIVDIDTLIDEKMLNEADLMIKDSSCRGTVKITKYEDEYIETINLIDCNYCTTDIAYKPASDKELSSKPKGNGIIDVVAYYNYTTKKLGQTNWTSWFPSKYISTKETNGVLLPLDSKKLPKVTDEAKEITYEAEIATYYSHRDKQWKFYRVLNNDYSDFSSEQPVGFSKCDTSTMKYTDYTEWSTVYPDKKDYRSIQSGTGYRWYYVNKRNKKVYWNKGMYTVDQPDDKYTEKDSSKKVTMYRYRDKMWRWYNGEKRQYSTYASVMPKGYKYIDEGLTRYTAWSSFKPESKLDNTNSSYREEQEDTYYRYRTKYYIYSMPALEEHLPKEAFEKHIKMSLEELLSDPNNVLDIKYKFIYRKPK